VIANLAAAGRCFAAPVNLGAVGLCRRLLAGAINTSVALHYFVQASVTQGLQTIALFLPGRLPESVVCVATAQHVHASCELGYECCFGWSPTQRSPCKGELVLQVVGNDGKFNACASPQLL
jgi:hypothetical protein